MKTTANKNTNPKTSTSKRRGLSLWQRALRASSNIAYPSRRAE